MDELGPEARALLDAAREGLSPDPAAIRRVHGRIAAASVGAAAGTALGVKLGIAGVIAALAIGGAVYLRRPPAVPPASLPSLELASPVERPERAAAHEAAPPSDEDLVTIEPPGDPAPHGDPDRRGTTPTATAAPAAASSPAAVADAQRAAAGATSSRAPADDSHRAIVEATPSRATAADSHRPPAISPRAAVAPGDSQHAVTAVPPAARSAREAAGASPAGIELGREVALIDLAMAALRRDDAAAALRVMQEYAAEAGEGGQLRQDAAAIEIEALCKLDDPGARDKRTAFDARFPQSAQRARLEAACR